MACSRLGARFWYHDSVIAVVHAYQHDARPRLTLTRTRTLILSLSLSGYLQDKRLLLLHILHFGRDG